VAKLPLSNPQILDGEGGRVLDAPAGLHGIAASNVSLARLNALQVRSRYQRQRHCQRQNRAGARRLTEAARTDHHFSQRRAHATRLGRGAVTTTSGTGTEGGPAPRACREASRAALHSPSARLRQPRGRLVADLVGVDDRHPRHQGHYGLAVLALLGPGDESRCASSRPCGCQKSRGA
jgi:hypothetical protein